MKEAHPSDDLMTGDCCSKPHTHLIYSQEQAFRHMTKQRPESEQLLYMMVDEALFKVWDALSLSIDEDYREIYYPYLPHVFDLLLATIGDGHEIADYLVFVEETQMGASKQDNLARNRAWRLVDWVLRVKNQLLVKAESPSFDPI